ncbi:MAG: DUF4258 domain-containing protein [Balneolia bacterium]|nr:DUF4258 domain-containing protein [Balneolia bacterium]
MTQTTFDTQPLSITFTDHAKTRVAQRGITTDQIRVAIDYGKLVHRQGLRFYFLRGKDVPPWVDPHTMGRIKHLMVVTAADSPGTIITAYKNVKGLNRVKRKSQRLL